MKNKATALFWFILLSLSTLNASLSEKAQGYSTALKFIDDLFVKVDLDGSLAYISQDAVFRDYKKGSAIEEIKGTKKSLTRIKHIELVDILFFDKATFEKRLLKIYHDYQANKKYGNENVPLLVHAFMRDDSVGCFAVARVAKKNKKYNIIGIFIFNKVDDTYKLVYMKDLL